MLPQLRSYYLGIVYVIPYALLLGALRQGVSRKVLAFAFGVPAAAILQTVIVMLPSMTLFFRNPYGLLTIGLPLFLDIVLMVLAYQAAHSTGLEAPASSLITTVVVALVYFYFLHLVVPFVYRIVVRR